MEPESVAQSSGHVSSRGHPTARIFHLLFKGVAIAYYVFCELLFSKENFITNFIVLLVFICADFWVVKNVSGRYLVGLRWWNDVDDEGDGWRFESLEEGQRRVNATDKFVFWSGLVGNVAIWVLFTFLTLLRISEWAYLLACAVALTLGGSNVHGYFKCSKEARDAVTRYAQGAIAATTTASIAASAAVATASAENSRHSRT